MATINVTVATADRMRSLLCLEEISDVDILFLQEMRMSPDITEAKLTGATERNAGVHLGRVQAAVDKWPLLSPLLVSKLAWVLKARTASSKHGAVLQQVRTVFDFLAA